MKINRRHRHLGGDSQQFEGPHHGVGDQATNVSHAEARERHLSVERVIPRDLVGCVHALVSVVTILHFEARLLQTVNNMLRSGQSWQSITDLYAIGIWV